MNDPLILLGAGVVAGGMNALAGGGSFVTISVLIATGAPSVNANASSTVALYPGGLSSAWVYRKSLGRIGGIPLGATLAATLVGGFAGAVLLLSTPSAMFDRILPWLLLIATLAISAGPCLGRFLRARWRSNAGAVLLLQFLLGVYGGYFGGAVGLMMVAVWGLIDDVDVKTLSAPRTLLVAAANTIAVLCFAYAGAVRWLDALVLGAGALAGGYGGAHLGRRLPPAVVRTATITLAITLTVVLFARTYAR